MRIAQPYRLLLATALGALAVACDGGESALEPPAIPEAAEAAPVPQPTATLAGARWADGYAYAHNATSASYTPQALWAYNRTGGGINIRRPDGTTGRYIVTFPGLSAVLGAKSTLHVSAYGEQNGYCKPMTGSLVSDKVEVRCFRTGTGAAFNSQFMVVILGRTAERAFAFANQPTGTGYAPAGSGSYNPAGTIRVNRAGTGYYQVLFNNLGARLTSLGGHVQVSAVASAKAYCKLSEEWAGNPNLSVTVQCYGPTGAPTDAKFTVLVQQPAAHLAYTYSSQAGITYDPDPYWSSNSVSGKTRVERISQGIYFVNWLDMQLEILDAGTAHVSALGTFDNSNCSVTNVYVEGVTVRCFAANGAVVDVPFTVLLGS
jgi:hypothetical protein